MKELWTELKKELAELGATLAKQLEELGQENQDLEVGGTGNVTETQLMYLPVTYKLGTAKAKARLWLYATWNPSRDSGCDVHIATNVGSTQTGSAVAASSVRSRAIELCKEAGIDEPGPRPSNNSLWRTTSVFADPEETIAIEDAFRAHVAAVPHVLRAVQEYLDALPPKA